jgi:putative adhesin
MKRLIASAGLACLISGPVTAQSIVGRRESTFSVTEAIANGRWIRIATPNGFIKIAQAAGERAEIRATKEIHRGSVEDIGFVVRRESGGITVCAVYEDEDECDDTGSYHGGWHRSRNWSRDHQSRVDFTVRIPPGVRVKAGSGNGDVSISGAGAEVVAATGNGRIDIAGTTGIVKASTGNGRVTIEGAQGQVEVSSGNGNIRVATSTGPVSATSGSGDIEVSVGRLDRSPDMAFSTGNGRVDLLLPEGFGADVEAGTGNGEVTTDFPIQVRGRLDPSRLRGTIGHGGGHLTISSGNGDVQIRKRP